MRNISMRGLIPICEYWMNEYLKWVCGFANAQGGIIYIGIDDAGNVVGVKDVKS